MRYDTLRQAQPPDPMVALNERGEAIGIYGQVGPGPHPAGVSVDERIAMTGVMMQTTDERPRESEPDEELRELLIPVIREAHILGLDEVAKRVIGLVREHG